MREFIVEADGGSRGNPGPAGYGAVVSDAATGETLRETAEYIGVATNNVAEYRGLLAGLHAARELDPAATVHVRMDSKLVIEQMSGRWKIKHPDMKPLAAQAARVFPPGRVTYEWMPRERNKHADRLANEAMDAGARGERWSETGSTAELDTAAGGAGRDRRAGRAEPVTPSGPPGDAAAGAARVRGALAEGRASAAAGAADSGSDAGRGAAESSGVVSAGAAADSGSDAGRGAVESSRAVPALPVAGSGVDAGRGAAESSRAVPAGAAPGAAPASGRVATSTPGGEAVTAEAGEGGAVSGSATDDAGTRAVRAVGDARAAKADADARAAKTVAAPGWAPADMGAPATFVLLRHGETPLTPQKRFSGSGGTDPSLSGTGREQAERAAALLARRGTIQAVVSSPLARTRETAGIVAARLGLDVAVDDGLRETDFGAWEGLTFAEVRERHPDDLNAWLTSPDAEPTGGGESFAATATRLAATRDKLVAAHAGRTVLLVTHVTPIKTLVRLALGAPPESLFRMELSAASLSVVAYYADGNASVRLLNDTSHLR
ncbi:bifunctional RNase H/acid phosphatase [Streptomyces hawaiiensis]|uniref:Bifunctional RNase H/acid phosphatase n=1 Tax=Streptomyces hawaiiensis TaxID=67305 RepID=A0A6G5RBW0_9ACTN|nr:bifunctional RNase H/acid phosphatase [Streptomyces hawaiiensis]QCD55588.1 bifunctional RNase H/acid phosphatase [Streptomyces hawaiiensis]